MFKNKFFYIAGTVAVILFLGSIVFNLLTPKEILVPAPPSLQSGVTRQRTVFSNIHFSGREITVPTLLSLNTFTQPVPEEAIISNITQLLSLEQLPDDKSHWENKNNQSLSLNTYIHKYQLLLNQENPTPLIKKKQDEMIQISTDAIHRFFPGSALTLMKDNMVFLSSDESGEIVPFERASRFVIPFAQKIDEYPIVSEGATAAIAEVITDPYGKVLVINFYPKLVSVQKVAEKKSLSLTQAVANINVGKGSVVSAYLNDSGTSAGVDLSKVTSGDLKSVKLEYRIDMKAQTIYPFYNFSGNVVNSQGTSLSVQIVTPAIATFP